MSKAILILDEMPKDCRECELLGEDAEREEPCCLAVPGNCANKQYFGMRCPDWCPLRPMPERMEENNEFYDCGYADGWNACLDMIEGRHRGDRGKPTIMMSPLESVPNGRTKI